MITPLPALAADEKREETIERLEASRKWMEENFWGPWSEAFQLYKCKTEPLLDPKTKEEDTSRTNVAMPTAWIGVRKKSSRMTRRPPNIEVRAKTPQVSSFLSGWTAYQWDRAQEQLIQRPHVLQGNLLGVSVKLHTWDELAFTRYWRRDAAKAVEQYGLVMDEERGELRLGQEGELESRVARRQADFDEDLVAKFHSKVGPEVQVPELISKYEGPTSQWIFAGDWYPEPEFSRFHSAAWHTFESVHDANWVAEVGARKYEDPETGEERTLFSEKALKELEDTGPYNPWTKKQSGDGAMKQQFIDLIYKTRPTMDVKRYPAKRYLIHREFFFHEGWCWIRFIGNEKVFLGEMPLPWDLNGRYPASLYTPVEDMLWGIGDSSTIILRDLYKLHNSAVSQRTDIIDRQLTPTVFARKGADLPTKEQLNLGLLRVLFVPDPRDYKLATELIPRLGPEVYQHEAGLLRLLQMGDPSIIDFGADSQAVPGGSQRATIGLLQERSKETITSDEQEALNQAIAEETTIKILMLQDTLNERLELPDKYGREVHGQKLGGPGIRNIAANGLDLQEDFEVFPELGSTLSVDDEMRRQRAVQVYQLASEDPSIWDKRGAAHEVARTYPSNIEHLILPPPKQGPKMEMPKFSISGKWETMEPELKNYILANIMGIPPRELGPLEKAVSQLKTMAEGAEAAQFLTGDQRANELDDAAAAQDKKLSNEVGVES